MVAWLWTCTQQGLNNVTRGKKGRKVIGQTTQNLLDLPEILPRKGRQSKESKPHSFHLSSERDGAQTPQVPHPRGLGYPPPGSRLLEQSRHLTPHSPDGMEEKSRPTRQPVGSNETENRVGGIRGEQWGVGEDTTQPVGFLRPEGTVGVPAIGLATQTHPRWLPLSSFLPP